VIPYITPFFKIIPLKQKELLNERGQRKIKINESKETKNKSA
jgi:hypothetical protein